MSALANREIVMLPRYVRNGPSSRLRLYQYAPALEAAGARVRIEPFFDQRYLDGYFGSGRKARRHVLAAYLRRLRALPALRTADLIWVEKEVFPFLPGPAERILHRLGRRYVVDYDDAIFHNYDASGSPLVRRLLGRKLDGLLRGADLVTAGNDYLADYARTHGATRIELIPTVVDLDRYPLTPAPDGAELRVGWIGTPANARYLQPVVSALNALGRQRPVRFVGIGAGILAGLEVPQEPHAWSEAREAELLSGIDIGVMPLPDELWERGKCAYKLIQYMAAGRPVIASPVGVNRSVVTADVGILASDEAEWLAAFRALAQDADLRHRMGMAGRRRVADQYALGVVAPRIVQRFADILDRGAGGTA